MAKFKLKQDLLRQMAESAKLTQDIETLEPVLTLQHLCNRLIWIYQMEPTFIDAGDTTKQAITQIKDDIKTIIKDIEL